MFVLPGKYKTLLISSLLLAYMASNFHRPFLDGLHYFSHLAQQVLTPLDGHPHVHHTPHVHPHEHEHTDHQHPLINSLSEVLTWFADAPDTKENTKKPLKKKKPELRSVIASVAIIHAFNRNKPAYQASYFQSFSLSIPSPPPRG